MSTLVATPRKIAGSVTVGAALAKGRHTPVNATAGAVTMTLPTGASEGVTVSVEKTDASANAVAITGSIRGVGGSTVSLVWQYESITLVADSAGSWWPTAGHKTKASLDSNYASQLDGTGKTAAQLNAWLAASSPLGVKKLTGAAVIDNALILWSNTYFDCSTATITRQTGTTGNLLRNAAYETAGRDTNIKVIGGVWDKNATTGGTSKGAHQMIFHNVDGIEVRDARFVDAGVGSKYCVLFANVTKYRASNLFFDNVPSDGLHIQGPATDGIVSGMFGKTGDDMISITGADYVAYQHDAGGGDVVDLVVEKIFPAVSKAAVKLLAGQYDTGGAVYADRVVRGVSIRDVYGTVSGSQGVNICDDTANTETTNGFIDNITVENIRVTTDTGYNVVALTMSAGGNGAIGTVRLRNITLPKVDGQAIKLAGPISSVTVDGLTADQLHTGKVIEVTTTATLDRLAVRNVYAKLKTDKSAGYLLHQQGVITDLILENYRCQDGLTALLLNGTTTRVRVDGWYHSATNGVLVSGASEAPEITAHDVASSSSTWVNVNGSTASCTLYGDQSVRPTTALTRTSTQTLRAVGVSCDVSKLTPTAGDIAVNNNASASALVGRNVWNGANWLGVQGYRTSGNATLVAGTVTVADTKVTSTTRLRLFNITPAGTVGAPYVSARTAGTSFTITSTSGSDTSTIRYEIIAY